MVEIWGFRNVVSKDIEMKTLRARIEELKPRMDRVQDRAPLAQQTRLIVFSPESD